ncbi:methionine synthase [Methanobacterium petrolearium]|uniref:methionine synthase n=1 Tax=Methanobacterium petrolearium TaxID=710190 RepID=UPI001AE640FB|nr:methionine synthase [Methanobacterium petrolearium]MBP1946090.1 5-methyltetrahydropteroyltriglutamate--homocysteine methyltransferase [Methanobacterium petrolearium]BDZ70772.1 methionine synthase [Methanobacterium petrolearium]
MLTTVVGSYPSPPQEPASLGSKISALLGSFDPYKQAVEFAVQEQIVAGIDIISTGQVRGDMIEIFSRDITGMEWEEGTSKIKGKILPLNYSIGAEDLKIALKTAHALSDNFKAGAGVIANGKITADVKGVKGIITGPTTLVLSSRLEGFYTMDDRDKAIVDMAYALNKEAKYLEGVGAAIIQFDEPFLSTGMADIPTALKAIKIACDGLKVPVSMHVCGDVTQIFGKLMKFPVDMVDCEFAGIKRNFEVLENTDLKKIIGFGCVDTKTEKVESPKEIHELIKKGAKIVGVENMMIDPDCGMRMLPEKVAYQKLKNMTEALKWLS